jgi:hypothetical protein
MVEEEKLEDIWREPRQVSDAMMVFPAGVLGVLMPTRDDLPPEFVDYSRNKWCDQCASWFFGGVDIEKSTIEFASHIDSEEKTQLVFRQLQACLGSYEPSHEGKMGGVGFLLSLFFKKFEVVTRK